MSTARLDKSRVLRSSVQNYALALLAESRTPLYMLLYSYSQEAVIAVFIVTWLEEYLA
jgi:hypothetical protein